MTSDPANPQSDSSDPKVIDLFSGVGGLSLGAARAGLSVCGAVEIDEQAIQAHARNFPSTVHLKADVTQLTGESLKHRLGLNGESVAGVIGGPPCQGFSAIGRRNHLDVRNELFIEFFRLVSETHPKFFLAENVPGIMQENYRFTREKALSLVEKEYTVLPPIVLAANEFGAATTRTRVFFVGYLPDAMEPLISDSFKANPDAETIHVKDALRGLPTRIEATWQREQQSWRVVHAYGNGAYAERLHGHIPPGVGDYDSLKRLQTVNRASGFLGTVHSDTVATRYANTQCGTYDSVSKSYRLDPEGFCPTLRAGTGPDQGSFQAVRPIHPTQPRVIVPREAARLQGFPDWFQFSPTKWHSFRQIGNSVSPLLAEQLFQVVARSMRRRQEDGGNNG